MIKIQRLVVSKQTKTMDINKIVGQRIKKARQLANLSQDQLGQKLFKTGAAIGYIERGQRGVNAEDLIIFAKVLKVPVDFFFSQGNSRNQLLHQTLDQLHDKIASLHHSLENQQQVIEKLMVNLPRIEELRLITESSLDPILLLDNKGKIIYATPSIHEYTGQHPKHIITKPFFSLVAKNNQPSCKQMLKNIFTKKKLVNHETQLMHTNGKTIYAEVNAKLIYKHKTKLAHLIIRNISSRKKIKQQIKASEEKWRQVLEHMPVMLVAVNKHHRVAMWNQMCQTVLGYSKNDIINGPLITEQLFPNKTLRNQAITKWQTLTKKPHGQIILKIKCKNNLFKKTCWANIPVPFPRPDWVAWGIGIDLSSLPK